MVQVAARLKDLDGAGEFSALLNESFEGGLPNFEGSVVSGTIVSIDKEFALIDVGLKAEGRIALSEFSKPGQDLELKEGDSVDVFVERLEDKNGEAVLSREKARREETWQELEKSCSSREQVMGTIFNKIKGGFMVDLGGAIAFLPGSQVDVRPVRDVSPLMNEAQPFHILKMDRARGNIVVSRRTILEETQDGQRSQALDKITEGQVINGVVKNLTDYGAFVDLGGVDGLLHVTDISWGRISHPSDVLSVGQNVDVQVIRYSADSGRISLGMKQLEADPWSSAQERYTAGTKATGRVTNIAEYGAFVELEAGVEGLVHVSEMSWTKKNVAPSSLIAQSQEVDVVVLEVDTDKRRISLGMKQCQPNPWEAFAQNHKAGDVLQGEVQNITEFGLFINLPGDIDGMVHLSDLSWTKQGADAIKSFEKGQKVEFKVLEIDAEKERIALGIKQLTDSPADAIAQSGVTKGSIVTCTVSDINDGGVVVSVGEEGVRGFIRRNDLSRERSEQSTSRFAVGEKIDAKITSMDKKTGELTLSIKARELEEDNKAMAEFGSTESGASLGDILGAALGGEKE